MSLCFQVIEVFHLQCVNDKYNFHTSLLIAMVAPIVIGACFVLYVAMTWFVHTPKKHKVAKDNALKWFLIFLYCVSENEHARFDCHACSRRLQPPALANS